MKCHVLFSETPCTCVMFCYYLQCNDGFWSRQGSSHEKPILIYVQSDHFSGKPGRSQSWKKGLENVGLESSCTNSKSNVDVGEKFTLGVRLVLSFLSIYLANTFV